MIKKKLQGLEMHHSDSKTLEIKWGVAEFVVANEQWLETDEPD